MWITVDRGSERRQAWLECSGQQEGVAGAKAGACRPWSGLWKWRATEGLKKGGTNLMKVFKNCSGFVYSNEWPGWGRGEEQKRGYFRS